MALNCPNCGAEIAAENINIQEMAALCDACNHVFAFSAQTGSAQTGSGQKHKRRKLKKPPRLNLNSEGDRLELSYSRVFDQNGYGALAGLGFAALIFTFGFLAVAFSPDAPRPVLLLPGALMVVVYYLLAVILFTVTRIRADDEAVAIQTGPLPFPDAEDKSLDADEITRVFCEETADSKKGQSSTRYYRVNAELIDGSPVTLLSSLPQEYAFYIAQALETHLRDSDAITPALSDYQPFDDSERADDDVARLAHLFADDEAAASQRSG